MRTRSSLPFRAAPLRVTRTATVCRIAELTLHAPLSRRRTLTSRRGSSGFLMEASLYGIDISLSVSLYSGHTKTLCLASGGDE